MATRMPAVRASCVLLLFLLPSALAAALDPSRIKPLLDELSAAFPLTSQRNTYADVYHHMIELRKMQEPGLQIGHIGWFPMQAFKYYWITRQLAADRLLRGQPPPTTCEVGFGTGHSASVFLSATTAAGDLTKGASSPYATSVGATDFVVKNVVGEEQAWAGSGGGFSYEFGRPAYQQAAVASYLSAAGKAGSLPDAAAYNSTGRAFPDVAALGGSQNKYCIVAMGPTGAYGTSAATPVLAAIVAKLNARRGAAGKPPLGFVNPLFYQHPEAFHDVTLGCNSGVPSMVAGAPSGEGGARAGGKGGSGACKGNVGFPAMTGWDAATGLGTPDFAKLAAVAAAA